MKIDLNVLTSNTGAILGGFVRHLELEASAMAEYCATLR